MKAKGISHVAICVQDLDKSLAFYRDLLGMKVFLHETQEMARRPGGRSSGMYHHTRSARRVAYVKFDGDSEPFLVLTSHPGDRIEGQPIKLDDLGISHISFTVDDVKGMADHLTAQGVEIAGGLESFSDSQGNMRTFFVYDPDGILVQFDDGSGG